MNTVNKLLSLFFLGAALAGGVGAACSSDNDAQMMPPPTQERDGGTNMGCVSTQTTCDTCTTFEQDPLNACHPIATTNCIPFDNARVPKGPDGRIPQAP